MKDNLSQHDVLREGNPVAELVLTEARKLSACELVGQMQSTICNVLDRLISVGAKCALLDFPNYANVGDNAIWMGAKAYLKRIHAKIVYEADHDVFEPVALKNRLGNGVILLSGGGNLGDLYPWHQRLRETVISLFPDNKIIQLPQSICFTSEEDSERARRIFNNHDDFTLLIRDQISFEFAKNQFNTKVFLCPDMAFLCGSCAVKRSNDRDGVYLLRQDEESSGYREQCVEKGIESVDWIDDNALFLNRVNRFFWDLYRNHPRRLNVLKMLLTSAYDLLARERVKYGCNLLARGKMVVTDRLHGHILALLLGIPHVILQNNNGKLKNFYETWTKRCELTHVANSLNEAMDFVRMNEKEL